MSETVEFYPEATEANNWVSGPKVDSKLYYDKYEVAAVYVDEDSYFNDRLAKTLTIYVDESTGILTTNIEAYERRKGLWP